MLYWPARLDKQLEATIELSLQAHRKIDLARRHLLAQRERCCATTKLTDPYIGFMQRVGVFMGRDIDFVEYWMNDLHSFISKFKSPPDILGLALTLDSEAFQWKGREWSCDYCGDESFWNRLVDDLRAAL
jgi:hypothetical protein